MQKTNFIKGIQTVFSRGAGVVPLLGFIYYGLEPAISIITGLSAVLGGGIINYFLFDYLDRRELLVLTVIWSALLFGVIPSGELGIFHTLAVIWTVYVTGRGTGNFSFRADLFWFSGIVAGFGTLGFTALLISRVPNITAGLLMLYTVLIMIIYSFILRRIKI
ncbi:MAG: hypothetical protein ACQEQC_06425 [Elusimicrobiota bacterium]